MAFFRTKYDSAPLHYWTLTIFFVVVFLTGGASRSDVQSLIFLRPLAAIFCGIGLCSLRLDHIRQNRRLFGLAAAIMILPCLHLIPLPPSIWGILPGREIIVATDRVAELGQIWRPISMVPSATWNALYSLFVPLAVLILGVQLKREDQFRFLAVVLLIGLFSAILGIFQIVGGVDSFYYQYEQTNRTSATGLFSNSNHQANFLSTLFPMLAIYASTDNNKTISTSPIRTWMIFSCAIILVPMLPFTGSRTGLIVGFFGFVSMFFLYKKPNYAAAKRVGGVKLDLRWAVVVFSMICISVLTVIMSRAQAVDRLLGTGANEDRFLVWPYILQMSWKYFPIGSGIGTFAEVYQIDEPLALLSPEYYNHAHNDWLEVFMTAGLPGLALLVFVTVAILQLLFSAFRNPLSEGMEGRFRRLGSVTILIFAIGSVSDYPLRTPALECLFVIALLWLNDAAKGGPKNAGSV